MKKIFTTTIILLSFIFVKAQVNFDWVKTYGGPISDIGNAMVLDDSGYVYSTGTFYDTADFDPDTGALNLVSAGANDIFISKSDSSGNIIWVKSIGGTEGEGISCIQLDANGNIYLAGQFTDTVDFDPDTGVYNLIGNTSPFITDIFVCKLNASGNFVWAKKMGGPDYDVVYSMAIDNSENVFITGSFEGTADFDPDTSVFNLVASGIFASDIFVQRLNADGSLGWAKKISGSFTDVGYSIALDDSGNIYTTGLFQGTTDFDPDTGVFNLVAAGSTDCFVQKLSPTGALLWAKRIGGTFMDKGLRLILDAANNIYIAGGYTGTVDFDPGTGVFNLTSQTSWTTDIFVEKLSPSGSFVWAKSMGGDETDEPTDIDLGSNGTIYTTGTFENYADFDPDPAQSAVLNAASFSPDVYVLMLDSSGDFIWVKGFGGSSSDKSSSIKVTGSGKVYTFGYFMNTVDFDPGSDTTSITTAGSTDIFLHKMKPCTGVTADTISASGCDVVSVNGYDYYDSGAYVQLLTNAGGCDSMLTVNVTVGFSSFNFIGTGGCDSVTIGSITYYSSGFYTQVTPNAAGCDSTLYIFLDVYNSSETTVPITACDSYTYNGNTYTTPGLYTHTFSTPFGCDSIVHIDLTIIPSPVAAVTQNGFTLTCTNTGVTYQWINCSGNVPVPGQTGQSFTATANGNYAVVVTENGCKDTSACFNITGIGIEEIWTSTTLNVYPNPSNGLVNVSFSNNVEGVSIKVLNTLGQVVLKEESISGKQFTIDLSAQPQGIYFMEMSDGKNTARVKVIKN